MSNEFRAYSLQVHGAQGGTLLNDATGHYQFTVKNNGTIPVKITTVNNAPVTGFPLQPGESIRFEIMAWNTTVYVVADSFTEVSVLRTRLNLGYNFL